MWKMISMKQLVKTIEQMFLEYKQQLSMEMLQKLSKFTSDIKDAQSYENTLTNFHIFNEYTSRTNSNKSS